MTTLPSSVPDSPPLKQLGKEGLSVSVSFVLRVIIQAVYFLLLARQLRAEQYGQFVGMVALVGFLGPLASVGAGHALIRALASHRGQPGPIGVKTLKLAATCTSFAALLVLVGLVTLKPDFFPVGIGIALVISDLAIAPIGEVASQYFQGTGSAALGARLSLAPSVLRLLGLACITALGSTISLSGWVLLYSSAGVVGNLLAISWAIRRMRSAWDPQTQPRLDILATGLPVAGMATSQMINNDADKVALVQFEDASTAGSYSAAYRLVDVALTPLRSLVFAAYPHLFRAGAAGSRDALVFCVRLSLLSLAYAVPTGVAVWIAAPLVPQLLGASFAGAAPALRVLAFIIPARAVQAPAADALLAAGHAWKRLAIVVSLAAVNSFALYSFVPTYGWEAAAAISILTDCVLALAYWTTLVYLSPRTKQSTT